MDQRAQMAGDLTALFLGPDAWPDAVCFTLPGGRSLFEAGEPADAFYLVTSGRLGLMRQAAEGGDLQLRGVIRPGEPAGEMALIAGTAHTATVMALRDSEIMALPRDAFFAAAEKRPHVMAELAGLIVRRARATGSGLRTGEPSVLGLVGCGARGARAFAEALAGRLRAAGRRVAVLGAEAHDRSTDWFSGLEEANDAVLYAAEPGETGWIEQCGRQADRLFLLARGDLAPPDPPCPATRAALHRRRSADLILVQPAGRERPLNSAAWLAHGPISRLFQMRAGDRSDLERMARMVSGRSVGLVLSGGGARAYAHVGAVTALRAAGQPIDFLCGASMGAVIGAGVAAGWDEAEIDRRIRDAFVRSSPLSDMALPLLAMTQGKVVKERLHAHFGELTIEDLWLPFFCVSSNLTRGSLQVHRQGGLAEALRASISLPGVLPPVVMGEDVLVDGAVMRNFPADLMRSVHDGPVVGVDVSRSRGLTAEDVARPSSVWRWIASGDWHKGPPLVSLLMRAATVSSDRDMLAARDAADLVIAPKVGMVEIRDWKAYEPAVAAGREATEAALAALDRPLTDLRQPRPEVQAEEPLSAAAPR